jgi:hypothetical protein
MVMENKELLEIKQKLDKCLERENKQNEQLIAKDAQISRLVVLS